MASNGSSSAGLDRQQQGYGIDVQVILTTVLSLAFISILVFFLHLYARFLLGRHHRGRLAALRLLQSGATPPEHGPVDVGLDPAAIAALPTFVYGKGEHASPQPAAAECAVCLSAVEVGERVRVLPNCKHVFHVGCIDTWLRSHSTCPICRRNADPWAAGEVETEKMEARETAPWSEPGSSSRMAIGIISNNGSASKVDQTACCNTDSVLELIGISFSVFVVFYVIIHYVRQLLLRWRQHHEGGHGARARRMLGLDPAAIAALPSSTYQKAKNANAGECAVCLSALEEGETVRTLPTCGHTFHRACIYAWLRKHRTCPVCRADAESGKAAVVEEGGRGLPLPPSEIGGAGGLAVDVEGTSGITKAELGSTSALQPMWSGRSRD